jgi:colanic acid/amylovoran biosynthesis glycosyltransferase
MQLNSRQPAVSSHPIRPAAFFEGTEARQTALIFRERLLAPSETFILEQAKRLRRYSPVMVGLRRTAPSLHYWQPEVLLRNGNGFTDKLVASLYRKLPTASDFFRRLWAVKPSILHAHFAIDAIQALSIARKLDIPLVVSLHGFDVTSNDSALRVRFSGRHFLQIRESLFREASAFICVSHFIKDAAQRAGFPESKLHVHYTGIDCERFCAVDGRRDPKLILFVGRLVEKKGCEYLLRAMAIVQQHDPEARVEIIGDGPLRSKLEAIAAELSIRALFRGVQSPTEVSRSMARARILCNPSITASSGDMEGFGMVFAEAQAVGTPPVSFAHAAIPEVVKHGQTGLLCPEGDIHALADSLRSLLDDSALWTFMSEQACTWVKERFDIAKQTENLELFYDDCVADHRRAGSLHTESSEDCAGGQTALQG